MERLRSGCGGRWRTDDIGRNPRTPPRAIRIASSEAGLPEGPLPIRRPARSPRRSPFALASALSLLRYGFVRVVLLSQVGVGRKPGKLLVYELLVEDLLILLSVQHNDSLRVSLGQGQVPIPDPPMKIEGFSFQTILIHMGKM